MSYIPVFLFLKLLTFKGDSLFYDSERKVIRLIGNCYIKYENITLYADTIEFYQEKKLLYAFSNSKLFSGKDSLRGRKIVYSLESKKGKVLMGKTQIDKGFLWGNEIFRVQKNIIKAFRAYYTTCDLEEPHYYFVSREIKLVPKKDIIARPVVLFIKDFPTLALPFWIFPATKERKSGFLTPKPGRNSVLGFYIQNLAYYFAINPYMDLTTGFSLYELKGIQFFSDFVYRKYRVIEGNIKGSFTRELDPKRERWNIALLHNHNLPFNSRYVLKLDLISDRLYATDYSDYRPEKLKSESYSYFSFSKNFRLFSFNYLMDYRDNFIKKEKSYSFPFIKFSFFGKSIGPLRFYSSSSFKRKIVVDSLNNREENKTLFLSEGVDFQVPVYIFNVQSRFNFSHTVYPEDTLGKKYPVYHRVSFGISSALTLYGTPVFKVPFLDKFLHIVTFSFGYRYSPYIKPLHLKESSFQRRSSSLDFSLKNDFVGKKQKSSFSLFTFTLSSSYDFLKEEKKLSDIDIKFSVPLPKGFTGGGSSVYSPYDKRIIKTSFYVDFNLKIPFSEVVFPSFKPVNISGTYSYNKFLSNEIYEERHFFNGSISGKITENWSFSYRASYDPQEKRISSQSVDLKRDLHCFSLSISWSKTGNFWDYRFRIWIKELPDLKIERTFFETLLPSLEE